MRLCRVLVLGLAAALTGCATDKPAQSTSWFQRFRPFQGAPGEEAVQLEVAVLEVPPGDRFVNDKMWMDVYEDVLSLEQKVVLEDNGFRVGQVGPTPRDELMDLLTSKRSCTQARRLQVRPGKPAPPLELGPVREKCCCEIKNGDQLRPVELERAQCEVVVVPTLTDDGKTRLQCIPQIKHVAKDRLPWIPKADRSGWALQLQSPPETFPTLAWEVALSPGEYVVVGTRFDRPGTLGHKLFVQAEEPKPVQRLLLIRTTRPANASVEDTSAVPPLAVQVNWASIRGASP